MTEPTRPVCSNCGEPDPSDLLTEIDIYVAPGDEGESQQMRQLCEECADRVIDFLVTNGFASHRHGGINLLEDTACPGAMGVCPYGEIWVDEDQLQRWESTGGIPTENPCSCPAGYISLVDLIACPMDIEWHRCNRCVDFAPRTLFDEAIMTIKAATAS